MGGDGGVIASNRKYLRGAGSASHTADRLQTKKSPEQEAEECHEIMRTCALTGETLLFSIDETHPNSTTSNDSIVVCPYGKIYGKEAAIEALLRRKMDQDSSSFALGSYIRGLKDLYPVRFHLVKKSNTSNSDANIYTPACPFTAEPLNGAHPAYVIISKKKKKNNSSNNSTVCENDIKPNVISDRAIKQIGIESIQAEYGSFDPDEMIRLAPPSRDLEKIKDKLTSLRAEQALKKKKTKKSKQKNVDKTSHAHKKQKLSSTNLSPTAKNSSKPTAVSASDVAAMARTNVASAVASDKALSSLFDSNKKQKLCFNEKEKRDNLFVR